MEEWILQMRCRTLRNFLNKIEQAETERDRLKIAVEADELATKILKITPLDIVSDLENYSLAVFMDQMEWAHSILDHMENVCSTRHLF